MSAQAEHDDSADQQDENTLWLVDGSGFIFRAYFALPQNLTNPEGTPVGAVLGFSNMLLKLLQDFHAPYVAVVFDAARENFRNAIYPDYKANREETPQDLIPQFPLIREATQAFDIPALELEGYAAGEMKHGPIALIEDTVPVVVIAPFDQLFDKTASNVQETVARGGKVLLLSDAAGCARLQDQCHWTLQLDNVHPFTAPIVYALPIQLLAYHAAVAKGTDVDQPRNLAKSVTVEQNRSPGYCRVRAGLGLLSGFGLWLRRCRRAFDPDGPDI